MRSGILADSQPRVKENFARNRLELSSRLTFLVGLSWFSWQGLPVLMIRYNPANLLVTHGLTTPFPARRQQTAR